MELASLFIAMLKPLLWLLPLFALGAVLASPWFKGLLGEYTVRRLIARRLDPSIYREFSDVTIRARDGTTRSEEHTSELQSLLRISYAVFCLKKKIHNQH